MGHSHSRGSAQEVTLLWLWHSYYIGSQSVLPCAPTPPQMSLAIDNQTSQRMHQIGLTWHISFPCVEPFFFSLGNNLQTCEPNLLHSHQIPHVLLVRFHAKVARWFCEKVRIGNEDFKIIFRFWVKRSVRFCYLNVNVLFCLYVLGSKINSHHCTLGLNLRA